MTDADKVEYAAEVARGERREIKFDKDGNPVTPVKNQKLFRGL